MFTKIQEQMLTQVLRMVSAGLKIDTDALQDVVDRFPQSFDEFLVTKELVEKRISDYDAALLAMNAKLDRILAHFGETPDVRNVNLSDYTTRRTAGQFGIPVRPTRSIPDTSGD